VPLLVYSLLRLALLVVCVVGLWFAGMGPVYSLLLGAVLAFMLSYLLLARPRDRAALWLQARAEARGDRPRLSRSATEDAALEDAAVDRADAAADRPADGTVADGTALDGTALDGTAVDDPALDDTAR
jgi:hypothetical protein